MDVLAQANTGRARVEMRNEAAPKIAAYFQAAVFIVAES
jgi:hypothetical protein